MSINVLDALPGKLDIKIHSPCILYIIGSDVWKDKTVAVMAETMQHVTLQP